MKVVCVMVARGFHSYSYECGVRDATEDIKNGKAVKCVSRNAEYRSGYNDTLANSENGFDYNVDTYLDFTMDDWTV